MQSPTDDGKAPSASLAGVKGVGQPAHFLQGGQGALLQDSRGVPWTGAHQEGEHLLLYRMSPADYNELPAVFNGKHPETGEALEVTDGPPEGAPVAEMPSQPAVFAPDYAPEEIAAIAKKLRKKAGIKATKEEMPA